MANTFFPTQIGTTYTGSAAGSQIIIGRNVNSNFEAAGFGQNGRPDYLQNFEINITQKNGDEKLNRRGLVTIDVDSLMYYINNKYAPSSGIHFGVRELSVCEVNDAGVAEEKSMLVLCSQTYQTGLRPNPLNL